MTPKSQQLEISYSGTHVYRRSEGQGYHYYTESVSVSWGPQAHHIAAPVQSAGIASAFLVPGLLLAASYAVMAAAFQKNFHLTL